MLFTSDLLVEILLVISEKASEKAKKLFSGPVSYLSILVYDILILTLFFSDYTENAGDNECSNIDLTNTTCGHNQGCSVKFNDYTTMFAVILFFSVVVSFFRAILLFVSAIGSICCEDCKNCCMCPYMVIEAIGQYSSFLFCPMGLYVMRNCENILRTCDCCEETFYCKRQSGDWCASFENEDTRCGDETLFIVVVSSSVVVVSITTCLIMKLLKSSSAEKKETDKEEDTLYGRY